MSQKTNSYFIDKNFTQNNNNPDFEYKLMFDGCSKGNPGLAGAGAVIYHFNKELWSETLFIGENFTNNHAEYSGLILGLQQATKMGIKHMKVEGDSLLVINHMKGLYKCKSQNLIKLYDLSKELSSKFNIIEYVHVLRKYNTRADELSNIAIKKYLDDKLVKKFY